MTLMRIDPARYRRTPWKTGGGVAVDIADAYRDGAAPGDWSAMLWRLGRTEIVAAGPFSDLSGYDRILTVIGGRGLVLQIEGGTTLDAREPFHPVRFRGEDRIVSRLETGPVAVLNLIADRQHAIDVAVLGSGETQRLSAGNQHRVRAGKLHGRARRRNVLSAGRRGIAPRWIGRATRRARTRDPRRHQFA